MADFDDDLFDAFEETTSITVPIKPVTESDNLDKTATEKK